VFFVVFGCFWLVENVRVISNAVGNATSVVQYSSGCVAGFSITVLAIFKYSRSFSFLWCLLLEEFVVRVFRGGKVTVPKRLRELFGVEDGDYVRLALVEVLKKEGDRGQWVRRKV
jgi:hypothetical protein